MIELLNGEVVKMTILEKIDQADQKWKQTKNLQYKAEWYQLIKEFADGTNNSERRFISTSSSVEGDDGRNNITRSGSGQLF